MTPPHQRQWLDLAPTGQRVEFRVSILFPWDAQQWLFTGERVYVFRLEA